MTFPYNPNNRTNQPTYPNYNPQPTQPPYNQFPQQTPNYSQPYNDYPLSKPEIYLQKAKDWLFYIFLAIVLGLVAWRLIISFM